MTVSFWRDRSWSSEHHADVVVVGAGLCGASCAWWLARQGLGVTLVDAAAPGDGASARGMGLVAGPAEPYGRTVDRLGRERALARQAFGQNSREKLLEHIVADQGHQISLTAGGVLYGASVAPGMEELERSASLLAADGFAVEWLDRGTVAAGVGSEGLLGGLLDPDGRAVHPLQLLELLVERGREAGVHLLTGQRIFAVEPTSREMVLRSEDATFHAEQVVLCPGRQTPLAGALPVDRLRPRLGELVATASLSDRLAPWSVVLDEGAVAVQQLPGGEVVAACWRDPSRQGPWEAIRRHLGRLGEARLSHQWQWRVSEPDDGMPLLGAEPGEPRVKYLVGCVDGGITLGFGAAEVLARWVVEGAAPAEPGGGWFSPDSSV